MVEQYLINNVLTFRVPRVEDALALRTELQKNQYGELISFSYTTKYIKAKGEIIEEYQLVKAKIEFTPEKDPEQRVYVGYSHSPFDDEGSAF